MPPKFKFSKEEIIRRALTIIQKEGIDALTVRRLSAELDASTKIVFGYFSGMDELKNEVGMSAYRLYTDYIRREVAKDEFPVYKASGIAYVRFAKEERELFKYLFMRDRSKEDEDINSEDEINRFSELLSRKLDISVEEAKLLHLRMWICVHGIATMVATGFLDWEWDFVSGAISDAYHSAVMHIKEKK